jgi:hypothetical protein
MGLSYARSRKRRNRAWSPEYIKAHRPRHAVFFRAYASARLLWAAVVGRLSGLLVSFGVPVDQPCHSPLSPFGRGVRCDSTHQRRQYA